MNKQKNQKLTVLYERLSVEDDCDGDSNSIINQRSLLQEHAERNGFTPFVHISDDGYSGTNWQRPGWQEVIAKIEVGEVANLLVKDSSRIGRDFLRVGLYRELFREKGVRLICVNDGYNSSMGEDDFTPFRDIMSEWYARDISKKIRSVFQSKGRKGVPISSKAPYGYYKDPADKNKWLVDEYAAGVVRRIFNLTLDGKGPFEICRILHDDKIEKPSFKSKKFVERPKEDWMIFEDNHPAIVDKETWELVQRMRQTKRQATQKPAAAPTRALRQRRKRVKVIRHKRPDSGW